MIALVSPSRTDVIVRKQDALVSERALRRLGRQRLNEQLLYKDKQTATLVSIGLPWRVLDNTTLYQYTL